MGAGLDSAPAQLACGSRQDQLAGANGKGTGRRLPGLLEEAAVGADCAQMVLETGPSQPEAMGPYERHCFQRCGAFGDCPDDPMSVFMRTRGAD